MKSALTLREEILKRRPDRHAPSAYGSSVIPVLEFYKELNEYEDRRAFQTALELLLQSEFADERSFAVDVCLGFFVFRDSI